MEAGLSSLAGGGGNFRVCLALSGVIPKRAAQRNPLPARQRPAANPSRKAARHAYKAISMGDEFLKCLGYRGGGEDGGLAQHFSGAFRHGGFERLLGTIDHFGDDVDRIEGGLHYRFG